jgi:hypothetical protein
VKTPRDFGLGIKILDGTVSLAVWTVNGLSFIWDLNLDLTVIAHGAFQDSVEGK